MMSIELRKSELGGESRFVYFWNSEGFEMANLVKVSETIGKLGRTHNRATRSGAPSPKHTFVLRKYDE